MTPPYTDPEIGDGVVEDQRTTPASRVSPESGVRLGPEGWGRE